MTPPPRYRLEGRLPTGRSPPHSTERAVRLDAPTRPNEDPAGAEEATHHSA